MAVDQRTPINIHFTVDVVKWPLEMTLSPIKYGWFSRPTVVHNHRVRMRMKLGGAVGRGISPTYNWPPTSPETSLSYRWNLVTNLDKYLRPECSPHCGVGIILMDIQRQGISLVLKSPFLYKLSFVLEELTLLNCYAKSSEIVGICLCIPILIYFPP